MSTVYSSAAWCTLQVTAISLVVLAITLLARRKIELTSALFAVTCLMIIAVTLAAPIPVSGWNGFGLDVGTESDDHFSHNRANSRSSDAGALQFDARRLVSLISSLDRDETASQTGSRWTAWSAAKLGIGLVIVFAILRLALFLLTTRQLLRSCRPVMDRNPHRLIEEICVEMELAFSIRLVQSNLTSSAAVFGWRSPIILFPDDWRCWSRDELRAVLAHELAHIARRDFVWRLIATVAVTVHVFNPIVHLLVRQLIYTQELAADARASRVVGRARYLRSLSSLTLKQHDSCGSQARPNVLPVFTGHLIRRIKMLNSHQRLKSTSRVAQAIGSTGIVLVSLTVIAVRGMAEPPAAIGPAERIAAAKSNDATSRRADPTADLFQRPRISASFLPENDHGMIALNVGAFAERADGKFLLGMLGQWFSGKWQTLVDCPQPPTIDFTAIETIAADAQHSVSHVADGDPETRDGQSTFGCRSVVLRFHQPVDWKRWIELYIPGAELKTHEGVAYAKIPAISELGPMPLHVSARDDRTIVLTIAHPNEEAPAVTEAKYVESENLSNWANAWQGIEGALVAVAIETDVKIELTEEMLEQSDDPKLVMVKHYQEFAKVCRVGAYAADVSDDGRQLGIRCHFTCSDRAAAEQASEHLSEIIRLASEEYEESQQNAAGDEFDDLFGGLVADCLENAMLQVVTNGDGSANVTIHTATAIPSLTEFMLNWVSAD